MASDNVHSILYNFTFHDGVERAIALQLNPATMELMNDCPESLPDWTRLEFHQCPNCPLRPEHHSRCPLAASLVRLVDLCKDMYSYDEVDVQVITPERTVSAHTTVQRAISSLLGLMTATSRCPHTKYFRPMARFHLPLASEEETIYRASAMYMLAQYFSARQHRQVDIELKGLVDIYDNIQSINIAMAERLRAINTKDSAVNAIVLLDLFAKTMPGVIEDSLDELRYLFFPYLGESSTDNRQAP